MSKFTTRIPVDVAAVISQLPRGSFLHSAQLSADRQTVEVVWDNDCLQAPFQHVDFPLENLRGELPAGIKLVGVEPKRIEIPEAAAETAETVRVGTNAVAPVAAKRKK